MVYQEQVMQIASALAGFTLGEADILRKAMGKKKAEVMAAQMETFVKGCAGAAGRREEGRAGSGTQMEQFAGYGFNKSHSAAYAWLAYQTAYLKAHYPADFMAALLTSERANTDKMVAVHRRVPRDGPPGAAAGRERVGPVLHRGPGGRDAEAAATPRRTATSASACPRSRTWARARSRPCSRPREPRAASARSSISATGSTSAP